MVVLMKLMTIAMMVVMSIMMIMMTITMMIITMLMRVAIMMIISMPARLPHCAHDDTSSDAHGFSPLGVVATCLTMVYVLATWLHVF